MNRIVIGSILALAVISCSQSEKPNGDFSPAGEQVQFADEVARLFTEAKEFEASQELDKAVSTYQKVIDGHPDHPNRYQALFMVGFLHTEYLKDKDQAIAAFDQLIEEYPDCDLVDDAQVLREIAEKGLDLMSAFGDSL